MLPFSETTRRLRYNEQTYRWGNYQGIVDAQVHDHCVDKANDKASKKKETQPEDSTSTGNQGQQIWPVPTTIADATPEETVMGIKTKMTRPEEWQC